MIGKMHTPDRGAAAWRTCFSSVCPSGYKIDTVKSALQKYLRRRETEKMVWCAGEMYLLHALARSEEEKQAAKAVVTNLVNRLIVMMEEELLFCDWAKYLRCREWLDLFEKGGRANFGFIVKVCRTLCGAELLRLNSDIRSYWTRGEGGKAALADCPRGDLTGIVRPADAPWLDSGGRETLGAFAGCLEAGDPRAYKWALRLMARKGRGARRWRRTDPVWAAWEVMFHQARATGLVRLRECLERRRVEFQKKGRRERHMWLSSSVSLMLHWRKMDWEESKLKWDVEVTEAEVLRLLCEREKIEIDSYAIDQHCSAGRRLGRGRRHFREQGSVVVGENTEYFVAAWRRGYAVQR